MKYLIDATGAKVSGDLYLADSLYKKCLEINPKVVLLIFELSGVYLTLNQPQKAWYLQILQLQLIQEMNGI